MVFQVSIKRSDIFVEKLNNDIKKIFDLVYEDEFAVVKKSAPTLKDYQYKGETKLMNHINPNRVSTKYKKRT